MILNKLQILETKKGFVAFICIVSLIFLGLIDSFTGYDFGFFVFYFIPVLIAGYYLGFLNAVLFSVGATVLWFVADIISEHNYSYEIFRYWNSFIRLATFLLIGYVISYNRRMLEKEKELNNKLENALAEVNQLSGLLPICASCKKIRNDNGYWEQVEVYIKNHTEAEFSHSICPVCMEKLYPMIAEKRRMRESEENRQAE